MGSNIIRTLFTAPKRSFQYYVSQCEPFKTTHKNSKVSRIIIIALLWLSSNSICFSSHVLYITPHIASTYISVLHIRQTKTDVKIYHFSYPPPDTSGMRTEISTAHASVRHCLRLNSDSVLNVKYAERTAHNRTFISTQKKKKNYTATQPNAR